MEFWRHLQEFSKPVKRERDHPEWSSLMWEREEGKRRKTLFTEHPQCPRPSSFQSFYAASISSQAGRWPQATSQPHLVSLHKSHPISQPQAEWSHSPRPPALWHLCVSPTLFLLVRMRLLLCVAETVCSVSEVKSLSRVQLFAIPWTVAYHVPPCIHGIFQARILEWVAISFSRGSSQPRDWT